MNEYKTGSAIGGRAVFTPVATQPTPPDGKGYLYFKSDGQWYVKNGEVEKNLATTGYVDDAAFNVLRSQANGSLAVTTATSDIPGTSLSVSALTDLVVQVTGVFDVTASTSADIFVGVLVVDSVVASSQAIYSGSGRSTVAQCWLVPIGPGTHEFELRAYKVGANTSSISVSQLHTTMTVAGAGIQ